MPRSPRAREILLPALLAGAMVLAGCAHLDSLRRSYAKTHVTGRSDTACSVGGRYGVSPEALLRANDLPGPVVRRLPPGLKLRIPRGNVAQHRVRRGDTLSGLADGYGVPLDRLARANSIEDPDRIPVGAVLRIPPGAQNACTPAVHTLRAEAPPPAQEPDAPPPAVNQTSLPTPPPLPPVAAKRAAPAASESDLLCLDQAGTLVDRARQRYDTADFQGAIELARSATHLLEQLPAGGEADHVRARAAWIAGMAYAGLERPDPAREAFRQALSLNPETGRQESLSPKIRKLLDDARARDGSSLPDTAE